MMVFMVAGLIQAQPSTDLKYRKYRVALVPGISSNGIDAKEYTAKYSLNLIAGYNGGLDGFEIGPVNINKHYSRGMQIGVLNITGGEMHGFHIGSIANISRDEMQGLQFAGITNVAGGELSGIQFAGITNVAGGNLNGIQFSGIANVAGGELSGIQFAGITNVSDAEMSGIQLSGIANISNFDMQGIQISGILNVANNNLQGVQLAGIANVNDGTSQGLIGAGIMNYSTGSAQGIYYSGVANYAEEFQGVAIAGAVNYSGHTQGLQISGLANIATSFQGIQVGGLVNVVEYGQGIQVGAFNFGKEFEGVPVGLISLYGNGRKQIDVWAADGGFTYAGFKTGTYDVYNMISIGYNPTITERDVWALAWSIGLHRPLDEVWEDARYEGYFLNQDFTIQHIQEGKYRDDLNHIYSYKYLLGREYSNGFSAYAGPTLNMMVSKNPNNEDYIWYSLHDITRKGREYKFWVGLTVGMQFF
ncbi:MAG TPA: hypothetical protein DCE78_06405 [Bacteroidetes bacterium]|nr:hypothetical protein [Bacteroidota bacterium]